MVNQNEVLSDIFTIDGLFFKRIEFNANGSVAPKDGMANVEFREEHVVSKDILTVDLYCSVNVDSVFDLTLLLEGRFKSASDANLNKFLPNAIAIMFPYVRAQVSLMTAQPNIPTVSLKPININALLDKQRETGTDQD